MFLCFYANLYFPWDPNTSVHDWSRFTTRYPELKSVVMKPTHYTDYQRECSGYLNDLSRNDSRDLLDQPSFISETSTPGQSRSLEMDYDKVLTPPGDGNKKIEFPETDEGATQYTMKPSAQCSQGLYYSAKDPDFPKKINGEDHLPMDPEYADFIVSNSESASLDEDDPGRKGQLRMRRRRRQRRNDYVRSCSESEEEEEFLDDTDRAKEVEKKSEEDKRKREIFEQLKKETNEYIEDIKKAKRAQCEPRSENEPLEMTESEDSCDGLSKEDIVKRSFEAAMKMKDSPLSQKRTTVLVDIFDLGTKVGRWSKTENEASRRSDYDSNKLKLEKLEHQLEGLDLAMSEKAKATEAAQPSPVPAPSMTPVTPSKMVTPTMNSSMEQQIKSTPKPPKKTRSQSGDKALSEAARKLRVTINRTEKLVRKPTVFKAKTKIKDSDVNRTRSLENSGIIILKSQRPSRVMVTLYRNILLLYTFRINLLNHRILTNNYNTVSENASKMYSVQRVRLNRSPNIETIFHDQCLCKQCPLYVIQSTSIAERWPEATLDEAAASEDPIVKTETQVQALNQILLPDLLNNTISLITNPAGALLFQPQKISIPIHGYLISLIQGYGDRLGGQRLARLDLYTTITQEHFIRKASPENHCNKCESAFLSGEFSICLKNNRISYIGCQFLVQVQFLSSLTVSLQSVKHFNISRARICKASNDFSPVTPEKRKNEYIIKFRADLAHYDYDRAHTFTRRYPSGDTFKSPPSPPTPLSYHYTQHPFP